MHPRAFEFIQDSYLQSLGKHVCFLDVIIHGDVLAWFSWVQYKIDENERTWSHVLRWRVQICGRHGGLPDLCHHRHHVPFYAELGRFYNDFRRCRDAALVQGWRSGRIFVRSAEVRRHTVDFRWWQWRRLVQFLRDVRFQLQRFHGGRDSNMEPESDDGERDSAETVRRLGVRPNHVRVDHSQQGELIWRNHLCSWLVNWFSKLTEHKYLLSFRTGLK